MKNFILFFLVLFPLYLSSQVLNIEDCYPVENSNIVYKEVVELDDNVLSDELFFRARNMVAELFFSGPDVTMLEDKENGTILVKAFIADKGHNPYVINPRIWFSFRIEIKDNRYRYLITDIRYTFRVSFGGVVNDGDFLIQEWGFDGEKKKKRVYEEMKKFHDDLNKEFLNMIQAVKNLMNQNLNEDW